MADAARHGTSVFIYHPDTSSTEARLIWSQIFGLQDGGTVALHDAAVLKRRESDIRRWAPVAASVSETAIDGEPS